MGIGDDERELFRSSVGRVRRLNKERTDSRPRGAKPEATQRRADEARVMEELARGDLDFTGLETGEELTWLRPGLQKRVLQRLRRGHWRVQDELDLHQMNVDAAASSIRRFLADAERGGLTCVKIIHGKGLRSGPRGPRIKRLTGRLLSRHPCVLAFTGARPRDGGTGAVYVLLGKRR